eukprot:TRINITY_DN1825_c0_g1_i1.p1 TRINITY_DN1825_c0_g1~~TRINITY_DN1825_c0_g1_i1.p1  ORF type:complete len:369 (-),score=62.15 TRINITY_DN1825_c0_g1_i1:73-1179(-)
MRLSWGVIITFFYCLLVAFAAAEDVTTDAPLVSVIVPTFERPLFVEHMLQLIKQQDYPNIEVIIIDDSAIPSLTEVPSGVTYVHLPNERLTIGQKRNIGSALAKGQVFVHWDDDDFFRSHRITAQVAPILAGEADMTVLEHHVYLFARTREFFNVRRSSKWGPHFGTFTFSRKMWDSGLRYPDNSLAEDYLYAEQGLKAGYTISVLNNDDGKHVYVRHTNTWNIDFSDYKAQVHAVERPAWFSQQEEDFYNAAALASSRSSQPPNMYPSELVKWDRRELSPSWAADEEVGGPKYPNYLPRDVPGHGGMPISWPVTGVVVGVMLIGLVWIYIRERRGYRYSTVGNDRGMTNQYHMEEGHKGKERGYGTA